MTERTIGIGDTSSFRYIGIEPPLEDANVAQIMEQIVLPDWVEFKRISCVQQTDTDGPVYTEFGFEVGTALDSLGNETVDAGTVRVAEQIAELLLRNGDDVTILEGIFPTDFQTPIFGSDWTEMAEYSMSLREQK
jgi:hypothetical protein